MGLNTDIRQQQQQQKMMCCDYTIVITITRKKNWLDIQKQPNNINDDIIEREKKALELKW
ncbi:hypothetical protein DERF_012679 [Dermatophagoides farinae]|uniref:Uncharacterized protein n=1 Tax=Dermatophagoides farinae TaxID=6954 RepID=A0A922HQ11_DERFA|nr:hypothetical protein DERF_012679 [Dermatophagoides farinae]